MLTREEALALATQSNTELRLLDQRLAVVHREDENFRLGQPCANLPRRFHAVDAR